MSSMSEDAMFKALLKSKPQEKTQTAQKVEVPLRNEIRKTIPRPGSEDMMFQVLLKNKPQKQNIESVQKVQIKEKAPETQVTVSEDSINNGSSNPQQQIAQSAQNTQVKDSVPEAQVAVEQAQDRNETEKQAGEMLSPNIVQAEAVVESLQDLIASVNMVHGLIKSIIAPVLVIILIVGIAILFKI